MNDPDEHPENVPPSMSDGAPAQPPLDAGGSDDASAPSEPVVNLDAVERDLDGVEAALRRLDDGTYWSDEVTGEEIADGVLANDPTTRRAT